ncbi:insecticidal delta-endotoxin Cry8Ea1 family protein [Bacillus cereus]
MKGGDIVEQFSNYSEQKYPDSNNNQELTVESSSFYSNTTNENMKKNYPPINKNFCRNSNDTVLDILNTSQNNNIDIFAPYNNLHSIKDEIQIRTVIPGGVIFSVTGNKFVDSKFTAISYAAITKLTSTLITAAATAVLGPIGTTIGGAISGPIANALFGLIPGMKPLTPQEIIDITVAQSKLYTDEQITNLVITNATSELAAIKARIEDFNSQLNFALNSRNNNLMNRIDFETFLVTLENDIYGSIIKLMNFGYSRQLLPIITVCCTLNLSFLRDAIFNSQTFNISTQGKRVLTDTFERRMIEYSDKIINQYKLLFNEVKLKENAKTTLDFRTFMSLQVLDQVDLWSVFKFSQFNIRNTRRLYTMPYQISENDVSKLDPTPINGDWKFINQILYGLPGNRISGFSGTVELYKPRNIRRINKLKALYSNNETTGYVGKDANTMDSFDTHPIISQRPAIINYASHVIVNLPPSSVQHLTRLDTIGPIFPDKYVINQQLYPGLNSLLEYEKFAIPDHKGVNVAGLPDINSSYTSSTIDDLRQNFITSKPILGSVTAFQKDIPNYEQVNNKEQIVHLCPKDTDQNLLGFNIPALEYSKDRIANFGFEETWMIIPAYSSCGDNLQFKGTTAGIKYYLKSAQNVYANYKIFIKIAYKPNNSGNRVQLNINMKDLTSSSIISATLNIQNTSLLKGTSEDDVKFITFEIPANFPISNNTYELQLIFTNLQQNDDFRLSELILHPVNNDFINILNA